MTCVIGLIHEKAIYFGADSEVASDRDTFITTRSKVFQRGSCVFAAEGSTRWANILHYEVPPPEPPVNLVPQNTSVWDYLMAQVVEPIRETVKRLGLMWNKDGQEFCGACMIGLWFNHQPHLFYLNSEFGLDEYVQPFLSVGAGYQFALGAMAALQSNFGPFERIECALDIACQFAVGVSRPYSWLVLEEGGCKTPCFDGRHALAVDSPMLEATMGLRRSPGINR
jgi:hypothetical protein